MKLLSQPCMIFIAMLGGRTSEQWVAQYARSHQHPVNRLCHTLGIPTILVSLAFFLIGFLRHKIWWIALVLFVSGWILQFIGMPSKASPRNFSGTGDSFLSACAGGGQR